MEYPRALNVASAATARRLHGNELLARRRRPATGRPFDVVHAHRRQLGVVARRVAPFDDARHLRRRVGIDSAAGEAPAIALARHAIGEALALDLALTLTRSSLLDVQLHHTHALSTRATEKP